MSFIYFFILSISARDSNSPQDDAELVRVPLRRNEPDPDFKDFTGVIDTGDGTPPYPFLQERPTGISFGILGSFDGKSLYVPHTHATCHMPPRDACDCNLRLIAILCWAGYECV